MAASSIIKSLYDGSMTIKDATGTPITLTVPFTKGDLRLSGLMDSKATPLAIKSRGEYVTLRKGDQGEVTGTFTAYLSTFTNSSGATAIMDAVLKKGAFASAVSTSAILGNLMTYDLTFTWEGTDFGDSSDHSFVCEDCHLSADFSEGEGNEVSISFTVYGALSDDLVASY